MADIIKKKRGRPMLYTPGHCDALIELMAAGSFNSWIAAEWKINEDTFYDWRKKHPEFEEAYKIGLPLRTVWWEKKGMEMMANGDNKGFNFWIAFMNKHHGWSKGNEGTGGNTTNVNIQQLNVLQSKSKEDLMAIIHTKLKALDMMPTDTQKLGTTEEHVAIENRDSIGTTWEHDDGSEQSI